MSWLPGSGSHQAAIQMSARAAVPSEGLTEEESASRLSEVVASSIPVWYVTGPWVLLAVGGIHFHISQVLTAHSHMVLSRGATYSMQPSKKAPPPYQGGPVPFLRVFIYLCQVDSG